MYHFATQRPYKRRNPKRSIVQAEQLENRQLMAADAFSIQFEAFPHSGGYEQAAHPAAELAVVAVSQCGGSPELIVTQIDGNSQSEFLAYREGVQPQPPMPVPVPPLVRMLDTNRDGKIDMVAVDSNQDGNPDTVLIDSNKDGKFDTLTQDTNSDGQFDTGKYDLDHDGQYDHSWTDGSNGGAKDGKVQGPEVAKLAARQAAFTVQFKDCDGNRSVDLVSIDRNGDGRADDVFGDADGDGVFETHLRDVDSDGKLDRGRIDANGDGRLDTTWTDGSNGQPKDGKPQAQELKADDRQPSDAPDDPFDFDGDGVTDAVSNPTWNGIDEYAVGVDAVFSVGDVGANANDGKPQNPKKQDVEKPQRHSNPAARARRLLRKAAKEMRAASAKLAKGDLAGALQHQQRAIRFMDQAAKLMEQPNGDRTQGKGHSVTNSTGSSNRSSGHSARGSKETLISTAILRKYGKLMIQYYLNVHEAINDYPRLRETAAMIRKSIHASKLTQAEKDDMLKCLDKLDEVLK